MIRLHRAQVVLLTALVCAVSLAIDVAQAEDREIAKRRAAERKTFTDAEIFDGFFRTTFGAEMRIAGRVDGIRKYVVPVRVFVENRAKPDRRAEVATVVADIKARVQHLDIAMTQDREGASARFLHVLRDDALVQLGRG